MATLEIGKIKIDGGTQARVTLNLETVATYHAQMVENAKFPPVVVFFDGANHWLADGFHRYHAARKGEFHDIEADIRNGTQRDAILFAVSANHEHGLPSSPADRKKAAEILLRDEEWGKWSDREIGRRAGIDGKTVAKLREEVTAEFRSEDGRRKFTTKHGTTSTMKTEAIGKKAASEVASIATSSVPSSESGSQFDERPDPLSLPLTAKERDAFAKHEAVIEAGLRLLPDERDLEAAIRAKTMGLTLMGRIDIALQHLKDAENNKSQSQKDACIRWAIAALLDVAQFGGIGQSGKSRTGGSAAKVMLAKANEKKADRFAGMAPIPGMEVQQPGPTTPSEVAS